MTPDRWQGAFFDYATSSFADILRNSAPHLLPHATELARDEGGGGAGGSRSAPVVPHGTTVLALRYRDGVIMAGDRQANEGYQRPSRRTDKIFKSDDRSPVGIPGAA